MQFTNEFTAPAAPETTYQAMLDLRSVASCLPGARLGTDTDDGGLNATVAVKVGPIRMSYAGVVRIDGRDDARHTATLSVRAREERGQGAAEAVVHLIVVPDEAGSRARMTTDLSVTGKVAGMGAGVMQEVANSMVGQFATCLASRLQPDQMPTTNGGSSGDEPAVAAPPAASHHVPEPEPIKALPLVYKGLVAWLRGLLGGNRA